MRDIKFRFAFAVGATVKFKYKTLDDLLDSDFAHESMVRELNEDTQEHGIFTDANPDEHIEFELIAKSQYIGCKDVNGVDIYEDDIVHWGHIAGYTENYPRKAVVELSPDISFKTFNLGENNHRFRFGNFAYKNTEKALEVIGNNIENFNLIEMTSAA